MNTWSNFTVFDNSVQNIEWNPAIEKLFYPPNEAKIYDGAYQLKVEPHGDILTLLSQLTELTSKLEMLDFERSEKRELCYIC